MWVMVIGVSHPWKWHHLLILSSRPSDTPSEFTRMRKRQKTAIMGQTETSTCQKTTWKAGCLYLELCWLILSVRVYWVGTGEDTCSKMSRIVFTQPPTIRITLWLCAELGYYHFQIKAKCPLEPSLSVTFLLLFAFISDRQQPHQLPYYSNILH